MVVVGSHLHYAGALCPELLQVHATEPETEEQLQLAQLLCTCGSVFSTGLSGLSCTCLVQHDIVTQPGMPVKHPPRPMAWKIQQDAYQQKQRAWQQD